MRRPAGRTGERAPARRSPAGWAPMTLVVVGTDKGEVLAFDASGKPLWQAKVSSEVAGPPKAAEGKVLVWSLDGRIFGLSAADGSHKWVYQRPNPPLTVRRFVGGTVTRGALFTGTAGGKLLGSIWPPGRSAGRQRRDPQGRDRARTHRRRHQPAGRWTGGRSARWRTRVGSPASSCSAARCSGRATSPASRGLAIDTEYLYLTDDKGAVQALDKATGASVWKQDKLGSAVPSGPARVGDYRRRRRRRRLPAPARPRPAPSSAASQPTAGRRCRSRWQRRAVVWQSAAGNLFSARRQKDSG